MTTIMTIVVAEVTKATKVAISDRNDNDNNRNDNISDNGEKSNNLQ